MSDLKAKMHKNSLSAGALPQTAGGPYSAGGEGNIKSTGDGRRWREGFVPRSHPKSYGTALDDDCIVSGITLRLV